MLKDVFYAYVRKAPFGGRLTEEQVEGVEHILRAWNRLAGPALILDPRPLAYILATAFHETGGRMAPVREGFTKTDAGARKVVAGRKYGKESEVTGHVYYGRGYVQLTWPENYARMGSIIGLPLFEDPDLALNAEVSAMILVEGMLRGISGKGDFTGKALEDYFGKGVNDPVGARAIVNGTDKAHLIAGYYKNFLDAINAAYDDDKEDEISTADAKPDAPPLATDKTMLGTVTSVLGAGGAGVLAGIDNPWSFLAILVVAVGVVLFLTGRLEIRRKAGA